MARALHLLKGADADLAAATIARQVAAGDTVSVVALHDAVVPTLPSGVVVRRAPDELSWDALLEAMFQADQVIAW
ncbi:MAG TPA: hypothetical protein VIE36_25655 [Methylomirabilota bacterium]|jgi:hypothetical protein